MRPASDERSVRHGGDEGGRERERTLELLAVELLLVEREEGGRCRRGESGSGPTGEGGDDRDDDSRRTGAVGSSVSSWYGSRYAAGQASRVIHRTHRERVREGGRTVAQGVDDAHALLRVERQAALEEVDRERVGVRVQGLERLLLLERERAKVVAAALRPDGVKVVERRRAEDTEDERELVVVCTTRCASVRGAQGGGRAASAQSRPGKSGLPLSISARMQPTDPVGDSRVRSSNVRHEGKPEHAQTSMANVYSLNLR